MAWGFSTNTYLPASTAVFRCMGWNFDAQAISTTSTPPAINFR